MTVAVACSSTIALGDDLRVRNVSLMLQASPNNGMQRTTLRAAADAEC